MSKIYFWEKLEKPFTILAPMENVTDLVFREIVCGLAKPDVLFTEFTSAHGLSSPGRLHVMEKLKYTEIQRPIVAQIWGSQPGPMFEAARTVRELGFDGVDINMGCPEKNVMKKIAGAGLIGSYKEAKKIIDAVKKGADGIPVSIKTRLRNRGTTTEDWIGFLLGQGLDVLTVHGRTPEQQSLGLADWDEIGRIVELKNKISPRTLIVGNGDVKSYAEVVAKSGKNHVDGVMIGRGIFSNPWVFEKDPVAEERSKKDYIQSLSLHIDLYEKTWGKARNFAVLKKFVKMYVRNFPGSTRLRDRLMKTQSMDELKEIVSKALK